MRALSFAIIGLSIVTIAGCKLDLENDSPSVDVRLLPEQSSYIIGETVYLDASGSNDDDGKVASWLWTFDSQWATQSGVVVNNKLENIELLNANTSVASFVVPPISKNVDLTFTVTITDNNGKTASSEVVVAMDRGKNTISGQLSVRRGVAADWDTNDPNVEVAGDNNNIDEAQPLQNPFTLGGYVNVAGEGEEGRSEISGDRSDFYRLEMLAGQTVALQFDANASGSGESDNALNLYLYDDANNLIDASSGSGNQRIVSAQENAAYRVEVYAAKGASNYSLTSSLPNSSILSADSKHGIVNLSDSFITGELVIKARADALVTRRLSTLGAVRKSSTKTDIGLYQLKPQLLRKSSSTEAMLASVLSPTAVAVMDDSIIEKALTLAAIERISGISSVELVEPNYRRHASLIPSDSLVNSQWHYSNIDLPEAWDFSQGKDIVVAVLDNGFGYESQSNTGLKKILHPDLEDAMLVGYDFVSDVSNAGDENGIDSNPVNEGTNFHGDMVAGVIAAAANGDGGVGVAWDASILPVRVLGLDGGSTYDVSQGILYAAGLENDSGLVPDKIARVINLSLGGAGYSGVVAQAISQARNEGVVVVAAAGNDNSSVLQYPASYDGVISVSATDLLDEKSYYSNYGSSIDVAAPGGDITRDENGDGYADGILSSTFQVTSSGSLKAVYSRAQGTSVSAPHVSGVIALMAAVYEDLTPNDVDQALSSGLITTDIGSLGRDDLYGEGLINARFAVNHARELLSGTEINYPPRIYAQKRVIFSVDQTEHTLELANSGGGTLQVLTDRVSSNQSWLSVMPLSVDQNNLGSYRISVARDGTNAVPFGVVEGKLVFPLSSGDSLEVSVIAYNPETYIEEDGGAVYVVLYDPDLDPLLTSPVLKTEASLIGNGVYNYQIDGVANASYILIASTNRNNDGYYYDSGETRGAYEDPSSPGLLVLHVVKDMDELDIPLSVSAPYLLDSTQFNLLDTK